MKVYVAKLELDRYSGGDITKIEKVEVRPLEWIKKEMGSIFEEDNLYHWWSVSGEELYAYDNEETIYGFGDSEHGAIEGALQLYAGTCANTGMTFSYKKK